MAHCAMMLSEQVSALLWAEGFGAQQTWGMDIFRHRMLEDPFAMSTFSVILWQDTKSSSP
eukprot:6017174-Amphidinium_carterae.3